MNLPIVLPNEKMMTVGRNNVRKNGGIPTPMILVKVLYGWMEDGEPQHNPYTTWDDHHVEKIIKMGWLLGIISETEDTYSKTKAIVMLENGQLISHGISQVKGILGEEF